MNTNPDPNDDHRELIFRAALLVGLIILILVIAFAVAAFSMAPTYSSYVNLSTSYQAPSLPSYILINFFI